VSLLTLSLRIPLFVPPSEARGPSALAHLGKTKRKACLGKTKRKASLGKTLWEAVTPSRKARGLFVRRRPERSEGGLALLGRTRRYGRMHYQCDISK
jgi:hypothetical protein